jgi:predicted oxidoreductase
MSTRRAFLIQAAATTAASVASVELSQAMTKQTIAAVTTTMTTYKVPQTDLVVSHIGYGCASLVPEDQALSADTITQAGRLINTAYDRGIRLFDLADIYGRSQSEAAFGQVLKQSPGLKNNIVIQSKCGIVVNQEAHRGSREWIDCSYDHIVTAVEGSLHRLGTDHLDILLLHWPDLLMRPQEIAQAFDELHRSGKVRYFGVSNHAAGQIALLKKHIRQPLVANQIYFGLSTSSQLAGGVGADLWDSPGGSHDYAELPQTFDYCRANDVQLQAYSPLRDLPLGAPRDAASPEVKQLTQLMADLASRSNTNLSAVALAWILHHPAGIVPIIGSTKPEHIIDNCAAGRVKLTKQEWYGLLAAAAQMTRRAS